MGELYNEDLQIFNFDLRFCFNRISSLLLEN